MSQISIVWLSHIINVFYLCQTYFTSLYLEPILIKFIWVSMHAVSLSSHAYMPSPPLARSSALVQVAFPSKPSALLQPSRDPIHLSIKSLVLYSSSRQFTDIYLNQIFSDALIFKSINTPSTKPCLVPKILYRCWYLYDTWLHLLISSISISQLGEQTCTVYSRF